MTFPASWIKRPSGIAILTTILVLAGALGNPAGAGSSEPEGRWDDLGEDGRVWVPAEPPSVSSLPGEDLGYYHNVSETQDLLIGLAAERPELFSLSPLGTSVEGRTIWLMSVTGPGDASNRPRVLFDGAHHGDEVIGSESLVRFLKQIGEEYDSNAQMRSWLDQVIVDVVPMVNPDGVAHVPQCSFYADCRKNANGVDLNRNYPDHWGGSGSSGSPGSATYRGPEPLSEPETQALSALLDERDYALHVSFHSGAEIILWPHGWTTDPPAEIEIYEELGDELTELTGVVHGQISTALYLASGTTVDQAYGSAEGWRPISYTPETYRGSGNAFNWWPLFNPPETGEHAEPVVDRWLKLLWHLVDEAPSFAPAVLEASGSMEFGPQPDTLEFTVTPSERRPLVEANVEFLVGDAPLYVDSANPFVLSAGGDPQTVEFDLYAFGSGESDAALQLDAGPAGYLMQDVVVETTQVEVDLNLVRQSMGTPHVNEASVTVDAGPFTIAEGEVNFVVEPEGIEIGTVPFVAWQDDPVTVSTEFWGYGLVDGTHRVVATVDFDGLLEGKRLEGTARLDEPFTVTRPQVEGAKSFPASSPAFEPFVVETNLVNTGSMDAVNLSLQESVPSGYAYTLHEGPDLVPGDPLGAPAPDSVIPQDNGGVVLVWDLGSLAPGASTGVEYTLIPLLPGEAPLKSFWGYQGEYEGRSARYADGMDPVHQAE